MNVSAKRAIKAVMPPIFLSSWRRLKLAFAGAGSRQGQDSLFDGDDEMFKRTIAGIRVYGEYGVGQSTKWVHKHTSARILSVDSSLDWIEKVKSDISDDRLELRWVDIGNLVEWGRPKDYTKRDNFIEYVKSVWSRAEKPECVLIDGRFRVCCFFYSLKAAAPGTKIIIDDYTNRPIYHLVEEVLPPVEICGRQALFIVPAKLDVPSLDTLIERFMYVMD